MSSTPTADALPQHLVAWYWSEVRRELIDVRGLADADADLEITDYRAYLQLRDAEVAAYHCDDPDKTAKFLAERHVARQHPQPTP